MTAQELRAYLNAPNTLNKETLPELRQLVEAYPYAQTFIFLYLYNLALLEDLRYFSELKKWAISLPSRSRLYALVEKRYIPQSSVVSDSDKGDFSSIDRFLEEIGSSHSGDPLASLGEGVGGGGDYFDALERGIIAPTSEHHEEREKSVPKSQASSLPTQEDVEEEDRGPLFTETLAKIYIQQQRYDRALDILRAIMTKNPEKNAYFADQIRFLERLQEISNRE
jgi:hypothetical protein